MLIESLESLRSRVITDFCAVMEFKLYTDLAYILSGEYTKSIPGGEFIIDYPAIAPFLSLAPNIINPYELPHRLEQAKNSYLLLLVHQQQVAIFENSFFDILRTLFIDQPLRLPNKQRQIEYSIIINAQDKDEIIFALIEKEINEIKYKNVKDWFKYLENLVSKYKITDSDLGRIAEAKATRDLFAHNAGIVNEIYLQKAGNFARFKIGESVSVEGDYMRDTWVVFSRVLILILDLLIKKYKT